LDIGQFPNLDWDMLCRAISSGTATQERQQITNNVYNDKYTCLLG
jgi:hypothetical protein